MAVAWRVDELAKRKAWNARRLADEAGVDIKTARNSLMGGATRADLETIGRIADALGVEPDPLWAPPAICDALLPRHQLPLRASSSV